MNENPFFRKLEQSLMKRAIGYNYKETTREFAPDPTDDKKKKIVKIKTVEKYMPPDVSALKALAELKSGKIPFDLNFNPEHLTDEELSAERERIVSMILQEQSEENGEQ